MELPTALKFPSVASDDAALGRRREFPLRCRPTPDTERSGAAAIVSIAFERLIMRAKRR